MGNKVPRGAVIATLIGNALEFYDFLTYTFLAIYIGKAFFPTDSSFVSLLLSVGTFGIGFLTRPLGGILIGAYADRVGRKPALLLTIVLMSVGTIGLVATPSYATIGIAAPLILIFARLVQGFALGGEVGPATAVLLESAPPRQRALYISFGSVSQGVAILAAGGVGLAVTQLLDPAQLESWGWRIPFAVGLVLIPVGLYLRRSLPETLPQPKHTSATAALGEVWREHRREVALCVIVTASSTINTYVGAYMTTYAQHTLGMPPQVAMVAPLVMGLTAIFAAPLGALVCERFGRHRALVISRLLTVMLYVPAFLYLGHERTLLSLIVTVVVLAIVGAPAGNAALTLMAEMFPAHVRSAGIALTYSLTVTIFGATTQFVITWLLDATGDPLSPAYYVMVAGTISIFAMGYLVRAARRFTDLAE